MRRLGGLVAALVAAVMLLTGCQASLTTDIEMDRHGRGEVTLTVRLDRDALQTLGLGEADPDGIVQRFLPLLADGDWQPTDASGDVVQNVVRYSTDDEGRVTMSTRKPFDNVAGLDAIIGRPRDLRAIAGDQAAIIFPSITDLPGTSPLINAFTFRLGQGTGDNPGFYFFGRGGVGNLGQKTCTGNRAEGVPKALRDAVTLQYRLKAPGGPGSTNAPETPNGASQWTVHYADCPDMQAESGGGSSSTLANGLVLLALSGLLLLIFVVRGVRRRPPKLKVASPPADDVDSTGGPRGGPA